MIIRAVFVLLSVSAIAGAAYTGYYGMGGESLDLDKSIRASSGGSAIIGRVK